MVWFSNVHLPIAPIFEILLQRFENNAFVGGKSAESVCLWMNVRMNEESLCRYWLVAN